MKNLHPLQIEARKNLAKSARRLRSLRGSDKEKELTWTKDEHGNLVSQVSTKGRLIIFAADPSRMKGGINYCSSFGPDSYRSFSGYLPGLNLEAAKKLVYSEASKHW